MFPDTICLLSCADYFIVGIILQDVEPSVDKRQSKGPPNTPIRPTGSLADITNSTYDKHTHVTSKVPPMSQASVVCHEQSQIDIGY